MRRLVRCTVLVPLLTLAACAPAHRSAEWLAVREIAVAPLDRTDARDPSIAADTHGRVAVTWVTRDARGSDVWFAVSQDSGAHFSKPRRMNPTPGAVRSFSEGRPVVGFAPDGEVCVLWAERRDPSGAVTDLFARTSDDGGEHFGAAVPVNDDHANPNGVFHGFATLASMPDGALFASWMDERAARARRPTRGAHVHADDESEVGELWSSVSRDGGAHWSANVRVADSVCACCRSAASGDDKGRYAVAYRTARGNLRDPHLALSIDRGQSFPFDTLLSADRWRVTGCPAIALALTANRADGGHVAWYTEGERPGSWVMPWHTTLGNAPIFGGRLDQRKALDDGLIEPSHPQLTALGRSTWIAVEARPRADTSRRVIALRALDANGALTPWAMLGADARHAAIAGAGGRTGYATWVEALDGASRVRVARLQRTTP